MTMLRSSLLIPTYRRPRDLVRCLSAIAKQTRPAEQVIVVVRATDLETFDVLGKWEAKLPLEIVEVTVPGQVFALNAGLALCRGDVVAITDDDAAPRPDWLARIAAHFAKDDKLGGLGGRDWVHHGGEVQTGDKGVVGRVLWYGRVVGNHHLGIGGAREVDILKGANCAFRMAAIGPIGFDTSLLGKGAQLHNDMFASLAVKRVGWKLIYDPAVAVDHFPAPRADVARNEPVDAQRAYESAFNYDLALAMIPRMWRRATARAWNRAVGLRAAPGAAWALRLRLNEGVSGMELWSAARAGRRAAGALQKPL